MKKILPLIFVLSAKHVCTTNLLTNKNIMWRLALVLLTASSWAFSHGGRQAVAKAVATRLGDVSIDHVSETVEEVTASKADVLITSDIELAQQCKDDLTVLVVPKLILCADTLSYFLDRVYSGVPVPLPFEWRDLELRMGNAEECAQSLTAVDGSVVESLDGLASRPYTLSQLARACGVAAGLDVIRTPYFSLEGVWFDKLAFPYSVDDSWVYKTDEAQKKSSNQGLQRENLERKRRQQLKDDDERLVATLCAVYDDYKNSDNVEHKDFEKDKEFLKDGASLYGNVVFKNDKYHRQLGTPRADNPYVLSPSS